LLTSWSPESRNRICLFNKLFSPNPLSFRSMDGLIHLWAQSTYGGIILHSPALWTYELLGDILNQNHSHYQNISLHFHVSPQ
jgi:hypothetical protein